MTSSLEKHTHSLQEGHLMPETRTILTPAMVEKWFGESEIKWVKITDLLTAISEMCIDGRGKDLGVATPGGNLGELVLFMTSFEQLRGTEFTPEEVAEVFSFYLEQFGKFYMHTDSHAVDHLQAQVNDRKIVVGEKRFRGDATNLVTACPKEYQTTVLAWLTDPVNMGCGHLRLMIQQPEAFGVRPALVQEIVRQFYLNLWTGNPNAELVILDGNHVEGAVVAIVQTEDPNEELTAEAEVPMVSPSQEQYSVFLLHPQVIAFLRKTIAQQLAAMPTEERPQSLVALVAENVDQFVADQANLGKKQLEKTAAELANYPNETGEKVPLSIIVMKVIKGQVPKAA